MEIELIRGLLYVFGELAPLIIPEIQDAMAQGKDIKTIDWRAKYGRSVEELQAQVDAQQSRSNVGQGEGHA